MSRRVVYGSNASVTLTNGAVAGRAIADTATHTSAGDTIVWDGSNWVDVVNERQTRGFVGWSGPPWGSSTTTLTSQNEIAVKVMLPYTVTVTNCVVNVSTAGSTLTANQNLVTLYNQAGTKLGSTADQTANWGGTGTFLTAFTGGPYTITGGPGQYCWVSLLSNGTTPATFRAVTPNAPWANVAGTGSGVLTGAALMAGRIGTGITAPSSFTPSSLVATNGTTYWIGLS